MTDGRGPVSECALRKLTAAVSWQQQIERWRGSVPKLAGFANLQLWRHKQADSSLGNTGDSRDPLQVSSEQNQSPLFTGDSKTE
jgi:hypothetical protein